MRTPGVRLVGLLFTMLVTAGVEAEPPHADVKLAGAARFDLAQVPGWSADDLQFFLHGSMGTEVLPEQVFAAFRATYPELFPGDGLTPFGLIEDRAAGLPIGFSRRAVPHLGGLRAVGINCAACHVAEVAPAGTEPVRVLGVTSQFDAEALFGAVVAATFQTADPANMQRFLMNYLDACAGSAAGAHREAFAARLKADSDKIAAAIAADPFGAKGAAPGALYDLTGASLSLDEKFFAGGGDPVPLVQSLLKLFHNMRTALHIPDQPPAQAPPRSGPGRNNAFGLLSVALFGVPLPYGPTKFGVAWDLQQRTWVHWDGNTQSPLVRNLAASLGLGAPLMGKRGDVDFALVKRHTDLDEQVRAPHYPWKIDAARAERGAALYNARCASCHEVSRADEDRRLIALDEVKTDPVRARMFDARQAELYNQFFAELDVPGYKPAAEPPVRVTQKYVAASMAGVWARSPYLHNGAVPTMWNLLSPAAARPKTFHRGGRAYDVEKMGYADEGPFVFDTAMDGNRNAGHEYGMDLSDGEKRDLIEYLKTR